MTRIPGWTSLAALASLALTAHPASAQTSADEARVTGTGPSYSVTFVDDPLNALSGDSLIARIVVRPGPARTLLLRPRASFVGEMLKSVEGM